MVKKNKRTGNFAITFFIIAGLIICALGISGTARTLMQPNALVDLNAEWYTLSDWQPAPVRAITFDQWVPYLENPSWYIPLSVLDSGIAHWGPDIAPGDHVVFSCWIKTTAPTLLADENNPQAGGRIAIQIYGDNGLITGVNNPSGGTESTDSFNTYVPFGVSGQDWTEVTIDFVVSSQYSAIAGSAYAVGEMVTPTIAVPVMQVWSDTQYLNENGAAWFSEPTFDVISPSGVTPTPIPSNPTPTPVPTSTPVPTPTPPVPNPPIPVNNNQLATVGGAATSVLASLFLVLYNPSLFGRKKW